MAFLVLYLGDNLQFDWELVCDIIVRSGAILTRQSNQNVPMEFDYKLGDDFTVVRIRRDREAIAIDGTGPASLDIALKLQSEYPQSLRLFDEAYSFDIPLTGYKSIPELMKAITNLQAGFQ